MQLSFAISDSSLRQIVRGHLDGDRIACGNADIAHAHFAAQLRHDLEAVLELDPEGHAGQQLNNGSIELDCVFFWHKLWE